LNPITVICPVHGEFEMQAYNFMNGGNCIECVHNSYRLGTEEFIKRAIEIHGNYYDYSKVNYIN